MTSMINPESSMEAENHSELDYEKETGASFTDSLTGLFNHGFFQISLEREIKRYERRIVRGGSFRSVNQINAKTRLK